MPNLHSMPARGKLHVGTSGWSYDHWGNVFYPENLRPRDRLHFYARHFATVEVNSTFYHTMRDSTYEKWKDTVPENFVFAIKANRFLTHRKRLKDAREPLARILAGARILKYKLGPLLFQLSPGFHFDPGTVEDFLKLLPEDVASVLEFRSLSWFVPETYQLLKAYGISFCIFDHPRMECPKEVTSSPVYIRMHGFGAVYGGKYDTVTLKTWAKTIRSYLNQGLDVYIYFNNDTEGYAVENARTLRELLRD